MSEKAAGAAVIHRMEAAEESAQERLVKKHVPAWVVSGAMHVAVIAVAILLFGSRKAETKPTDKILATTAEKADEPEDKNLTNDDLGVDSNIQSALPEIDRVENKTVDDKVTQDNVGQPNTTKEDPNANAPAGLGANFTEAGATGVDGGFKGGDGGAGGPGTAATAGRSGATKSKLIKEGGGNAASEAAVARGLAWLVKQQYYNKDNPKDPLNGSWVFDGSHKTDRTCATGMALLPFLAAGVTHKKKEDKDFKGYEVNVLRGLEYLTRNCPLSGGANAGRLSPDVYGNAIAALPLCEAVGMTKDPALKPYAQAAVNFIQRTQGQNGSWGYGNRGNGDTSIVGWQIQVLKAAKLSKELAVDDRIIQNANKFLDHASAGSRKAMYGYNDNSGAAPGTALTAVGLLCRYYISEWGPVHPGMIEGVQGLMKHGPPANGGAVKDMYYFYYATQVVHFFEGEDWKTWNEGPKNAVDGTRKGGMRDWLVNSQSKKDLDAGSWDPEGGWIGSSCGRLGTTCMCLLTLEVYYRHLPLYKRGANGDAIKIID